MKTALDYIRETFKTVSSLSLTLALSGSLAYAAGGTSAGLTFLQSPSARSSALGDSLTAASDDISATVFNPGSLATLQTGHATMLYEKGLLDDAFGQAAIGSPTKFGGWGLNIGYYNSGEFELNDGAQTRTVVGQQDMVAGLSLASRIGSASFGITAKFITSELIEQERATAYAADFGLQVPLSGNLRLGLAGQNFGTQLKYVEEGDDLPRAARAGLSYGFTMASLPGLLLVDGTYLMNEQEFIPAGGLELSMGPLPLRAGVKKGTDGVDFSIGTGFLFGSGSLDYSFEFENELGSQHLFNVGYRFGSGQDYPALVKNKKQNEPQYAKKEEPVQKHRPQVVSQPSDSERRYSLGNQQKFQTSSTDWRTSKKSSSPSVYVVKPGDTLAKIAEANYGTKKMWKEIFAANTHLLDNPSSIKKGQTIILP